MPRRRFPDNKVLTSGWAVVSGIRRITYRVHLAIVSDWNSIQRGPLLSRSLCPRREIYCRIRRNRSSTRDNKGTRRKCLILSEEKNRLTFLGSRISIVNLADEILQSILGLLVDCDKKVFDDENCDIQGRSSSYRALQLSGICRAFRYALLRMSGAWAVVSSDNPGEKFLALCVERSSSRGLRIYHTSTINWSYERAAKLLTHLVSLQSLQQVQIELISVNIEIESSTWSRTPNVHQKEMAQLLGKLDTRALSVLKILYRKTFRYSNTDDGLVGENNGGNGLGTGVETNEGAYGVDA